MKKKNAVAAVDAIFDAITKAMAKGDEVAIAGFGVFKTAKRAARMGVNPKTGEKFKLPPLPSRNSEPRKL